MNNKDTRWVSVTPTVTANSAYSSGHCVGGLLTFTGIIGPLTQTGKLRSVVITDKDKQSANYYLNFFNANPTGSTVTDHAALAIASADLSKLLPYAAELTTDLESFSANGMVSVASLQEGVKSATTGSGAKTLYGALLTTSTPTYTSTSALTISIEVESD